MLFNRLNEKYQIKIFQFFILFLLAANCRANFTIGEKQYVSQKLKRVLTDPNLSTTNWTNEQKLGEAEILYYISTETEPKESGFLYEIRE